MRANWMKTKVMARKPEECRIEVNGERVEEDGGDELYLGAMISGNGSMDGEVELRIGMVARMIGAIGSSVLGRKELTKGTKLRVVK